MPAVFDLEACAGVKGVVVSVNRKRAKYAAPGAQEVLSGSGRIAERVLGLEVGVSSTSFLQVNTKQAERLYALALELAGPKEGERAVDLYCGTGTLSLLLAREAGEVTGVEALPQAVDDARENARRNGVANCRFVCADVQEAVPGLLEGADVVTVNPPRAGVYRAVVRAICDLKPRRIVYVSCNPETLARDLAGFRQGGYRIGKAQPVDMFPHTPHCEVVVGLSV